MTISNKQDTHSNLQTNTESTKYDFAVIDFETTGFKDSVTGIPMMAVEVAIVQVSKTGEIGEKWSTTLNPLRPIEPSATAVHKLSAQDLSSAPTFESKIEEIKARILGKMLVAHNAEFDAKVLRNELGRFNGHGLRGKQLVFIDTLRLIKSMGYILPNYKLDTIIKAYGIENANPHRALGDALATAELLAIFLKDDSPLEATRISATSKSPTGMFTMTKIDGDYHVDQEVTADYENYEDLWKKSLLKKPRQRPAVADRPTHSISFSSTPQPMPVSNPAPQPPYPANSIRTTSPQPVDHRPRQMHHAPEPFTSYNSLILFSAFLGMLGVDRFLTGRTGLGVAKLLTFGGFGIWWTIDYILAVSGVLRDRNGVLIKGNMKSPVVAISAIPFVLFWIITIF